MPRFSLIVPVYRVEAYLPKCIESVLAQTCQDYELLLIDDGSPDGCGKLCDDYAAKYPDKLRAIHQPNGGAGAARNRGIQLASGEYLLFVDGDDSLSPDFLAALSAVIQKTPADLILFGAQVERDGKKVDELHENVPAKMLLSVKDEPTLYFGVMAPWNRAYRRALFTEHDIILCQDTAMQKNISNYPNAFYPLDGKVDISQFAQFKVGYGEFDI